MRNILETLTREGVLTESAARRVRDLCSHGTPLDEALRQADGVAEDRLLRTLGAALDIPYVELETLNPAKELLGRFPARILLERQILPLEDQGAVVTVATSRVFDHSALDELRLVSGRECRPVLATTAEIERSIKRCLGIGADTLQSMGNDDVEVVNEHSGDDELDLTKTAEDASIIKFVNQIMAEALELRATDVHVEPFEKELRVRYRIDGELQEANIPSSVKRYHAAIVSRLKILSHLDIAEKRLPQDGRIRLKIGKREIDLRVSVIPMIHGEAVVLRILDRGDALLGLEHLGMAARDRREFERVLDLPHGIVLVTGPTGSGKTTTLYAALSCINDVERKIITIEDPVEYQLRGINQIQVSAKTGLTFAAGLRSILRHDPDVVLVGEIRDGETAEIAVQASLTGHLVFSTLHTNDAPGAVTRLIEMGVEPYLVSSSLEMVIAQRLVRLICPHCKEVDPTADMPALRREFGSVVPEVLYHGKGCRQCMNTGFRGRMGVFEMMPITEELRALILERRSTGELRRVAVQQGMNSLRGDGWRLLGEGRTALQEVLRNTKEEQLTARAGQGRPA